MKKMKKWMKFAAKNCHFCEIKRLKKNEKMKNEKKRFLQVSDRRSKSAAKK
jgi:hypothetical protein